MEQNQKVVSEYQYNFFKLDDPVAYIENAKNIKTDDGFIDYLLDGILGKFQSKKNRYNDDSIFSPNEQDKVPCKTFGEAINKIVEQTTDLNKIDKFFIQNKITLSDIFSMKRGQKGIYPNIEVAGGDRKGNEKQENNYQINGVKKCIDVDYKFYQNDIEVNVKFDNLAFLSYINFLLDRKIDNVKSAMKIYISRNSDSVDEEAISTKLTTLSRNLTQYYYYLTNQLDDDKKLDEGIINDIKATYENIKEKYISKVINAYIEDDLSANALNLFDNLYGNEKWNFGTKRLLKFRIDRGENGYPSISQCPALYSLQQEYRSIDRRDKDIIGILINQIKQNHPYSIQKIVQSSNVLKDNDGYSQRYNYKFRINESPVEPFLENFKNMEINGESINNSFINAFTPYANTLMGYNIYAALCYDFDINSNIETFLAKIISFALFYIEDENKVWKFINDVVSILLENVSVVDGDKNRLALINLDNIKALNLDNNKEAYIPDGKQRITNIEAKEQSVEYFRSNCFRKIKSIIENDESSVIDILKNFELNSAEKIKFKSMYENLEHKSHYYLMSIDMLAYILSLNGDSLSPYEKKNKDFALRNENLDFLLKYQDYEAYLKYLHEDDDDTIDDDTILNPSVYITKENKKECYEYNPKDPSKNFLVTLDRTSALNNEYITIPIVFFGNEFNRIELKECANQCIRVIVSQNTYNKLQQLVQYKKGIAIFDLIINQYFIQKVAYITEYVSKRTPYKLFMPFIGFLQDAEKDISISSYIRRKCYDFSYLVNVCFSGKAISTSQSFVASNFVNFFARVNCFASAMGNLPLLDFYLDSELYENRKYLVGLEKCFFKKDEKNDKFKLSLYVFSNTRKPYDKKEYKNKNKHSLFRAEYILSYDEVIKNLKAIKDDLIGVIFYNQDQSIGKDIESTLLEESDILFCGVRSTYLEKNAGKITSDDKNMNYRYVNDDISIKNPTICKNFCVTSDMSHKANQNVYGMNMIEYFLRQNCINKIDLEKCKDKIELFANIISILTIHVSASSAQGRVGKLFVKNIRKYRSDTSKFNKGNYNTTIQEEKSNGSMNYIKCCFFDINRIIYNLTLDKDAKKENE